MSITERMIGVERGTYAEELREGEREERRQVLGCELGSEGCVRDGRVTVVEERIDVAEERCAEEPVYGGETRLSAPWSYRPCIVIVRTNVAQVKATADRAHAGRARAVHGEHLNSIDRVHRVLDTAMSVVSNHKGRRSIWHSLEREADVHFRVAREGVHNLAVTVVHGHRARNVPVNVLHERHRASHCIHYQRTVVRKAGEYSLKEVPVSKVARVVPLGMVTFQYVWYCSV